MTREQIADMMEAIETETGHPFAYYQYPVGEAPAPPYNIFYYPGRDDFLADGVNYAKITELTIEHYADNKDFGGEDSIEAVLNDYGLVYDKDEAYIDRERLYETIYTMEVLIDG